MVEVAQGFNMSDLGLAERCAAIESAGPAERLLDADAL
jgi:hypothetical protein